MKHVILEVYRAYTHAERCRIISTLSSALWNYYHTTNTVLPRASFTMLSASTPVLPPKLPPFGSRTNPPPPLFTSWPA